ncbi:MBL fold metallo-hydrolase [Fulvivirgaceae bacterium BMA10]|uniref:MBL fold metallo-hydrolase n=1 Tax=Splendidivirga corallicola TaxID=3051826 RepID=A0ABT8KP27_9BACT|nr:MBL fold metallo-hydrolase [Fulvivirgaceae bacterium BMA10]
MRTLGLTLCYWFVTLLFTSAQNLEIHVINVGQGNCTFIKGPNGTTILFDGGKKTKGETEIVPYLDSLGYGSDNQLDYIIVSHKDADHFEGLIEVLEAGYDFRKAYDNGSRKRQYNYNITYKNLLKNTTARKRVTMKPGTEIDLGNGAKAVCVISGGKIIGKNPIWNLSENDKSLGLLIKYNDFEFFSAGDLGGGQNSLDNRCTHRKTGQADLETPLIKALQAQRLVDRDLGIEVLHVSHHGSESSTNHMFMNAMSPRVAVVSVGQNQSRSYQHPRVDIIERVLMAKSECITADPALVLQTDEGLKTYRTSTEGFTVGDILITVYSDSRYMISATGEIEGERSEILEAGLPITFAPDTK